MAPSHWPSEASSRERRHAGWPSWFYCFYSWWTSGAYDPGNLGVALELRGVARSVSQSCASIGSRGDGGLGVRNAPCSVTKDHGKAKVRRSVESGQDGGSWDDNRMAQRTDGLQGRRTGVGGMAGWDKEAQICKGKAQECARGRRVARKKRDAVCYLLCGKVFFYSPTIAYSLKSIKLSRQAKEKTRQREGGADG